ncbi:MAG: TraR/DksA C4-type zinc finger protein [Myxococcales bacterium]|nr:TraR/DksA C4-type zinc finger protein [Myxococcales bacterium]
MEELDDAELRELGDKLRELSETLELALEGSREAAQVVSLDQPIGRLSRMDAIQQQKIAEASRGQQQRRLGQVRVALAALEAGEYGVCRACEEPIGMRRLSARPESPFCLPCQARRERG